MQNTEINQAWYNLSMNDMSANKFGMRKTKKHEYREKQVWHWRDLLIKMAIFLIVAEIILAIVYFMVFVAMPGMNVSEEAKSIMGLVMASVGLAIVGLCLVAGNLKSATTKNVLLKIMAIIALFANVGWVVLGIVGVWQNELLYVCEEVIYNCGTEMGSDGQLLNCLSLYSSNDCGWTNVGWVMLVLLAIGLILSLILWIVAVVERTKRRKEIQENM